MTTRIIRIAACVGALATLALQPQFVGGASAVGASSAPTQPSKARGATPTPTSTFSSLPSMGGPSEALAVNECGHGHRGFELDRRDVLHAMRWTLQNGAWIGSSLPRAPSANSAIARGVNNNGDAAGNDFPGARHAVLWPAGGGFTMLGCNNAVLPETVYAIATGGQIVVGTAGPGLVRRRVAAGRGLQTDASRPGRGTDLAGAFAVNGDGTVVGGAAAAIVPGEDSVPVRWQRVSGGWLIEQLDSRRGHVMGANATGDLFGIVDVPCASVDGCQRAVIWYATGGSRELGTLGGKDSWARDINATGEVVGASTSPSVGNTAYFWSNSRGMLQLPFKGRWAAANALSNVRPDGTRVVVGTNSLGQAVAWVVRNP